MAVTEVGRIDTAGWPSKFENYDVGGNGVLFVSFNPDAESPNWYALSSIKDVNLTNSVDEIDATTRRSDRVKSSLPGQITMSFDTTIVVDMGDPVYKALQEAYLTGFIPGFGVFTSNGNGPVFYGNITDLSRSEALNDVVTASLKVSCTQFKYWFSSYDSSATSGSDDAKHPMGHEIIVNAETTITLAN